MKEYKLSLRDLLGDEYIESAISAAVFFGSVTEKQARKLADEKIRVCSAAYVKKLNSLLESVGKKVTATAPFNDFNGAPTDSFGKAAHNSAAPVAAYGAYRIGEDGRLYLAAKSEHYHAPLGHGFEAYKLLRNAAALGITNATHNNTRGYITRLAEYELVRAANGAEKSAMPEILASKEKHILNRVINLETGSLACEAAIKMMLMRFYRLDDTYEAPIYDGKTPVFFVMADKKGGSKANYHGTTVLAQTFRGMWGELYEKAEKCGLYKVVPVAINDLDDFRTKLEAFDCGNYKVAGLLHEIVLMNYGGYCLEKEYINRVYDLCDSHDIPTMCDEIQSCMWYKGMFLFRLFGLKPDFVIVGKGFPGGNYAASRVLTTAPLDKLNQFGALVTNGQEELASLSYLITMDFSRRNAEHIDFISDYYSSGLRRIGEKYSDKIKKIEGCGLLTTVVFDSAEDAVMLAQKMNAKCIDTSVQTYKADCPTAVLTKPPLISTKEILDFILNAFDESMR